MANAVVTGGLGFIGSHVVDAYLAAGDRVTVIDSEIASVIDRSEQDVHPHCEVIRKSIEDFFEDGDDFKIADRVVHAASHVGLAGILRYSGELGSDMVRCAEYLLEGYLEGYLEADIPLCVLSSVEVYGRSNRTCEDYRQECESRANTRVAV